MTSEQNLVQLPIEPRPKELTDMSRSEQLGKFTFELEITENDVRARQFSCHLVIYNGTQNSVDLLAINYRLGTGVSVEKNENTSSIDLKEEYDGLKKDLQVLLRSLYLTSSEEFRAEYSKRLLEALQNQFSLRSVMLSYFYIITFQFRTYVRGFTQDLRRMEFPITSADSARKILDGITDKKLISTIVADLLMAKVERMAAIEKVDQNFLRPE